MKLVSRIDLLIICRHRISLSMYMCEKSAELLMQKPTKARRTWKIWKEFSFWFEFWTSMIKACVLFSSNFYEEFTNTAIVCLLIEIKPWHFSLRQNWSALVSKQNLRPGGQRSLHFKFGDSDWNFIPIWVFPLWYIPCKSISYFSIP